jgi:hypothetical protein
MGPRHDPGLGTAGTGRCPDDWELGRPGLIGVQQFRFELGRRIYLLGGRLIGVEFHRR